MKNEKTLSILVIALIIIAGGAAYILYPHGADQDSILVPESEQVTQSTEAPATKPTEPLKRQSASYLGRDGVYVVQYTNTGFVPKQLQIPRGKSVRFINMSSKALQVFSDDTVTPKFVELNEAKSIGKGATYTFSFVNTGLWLYHNQAYPSHKANILVY